MIESQIRNKPFQRETQNKIHTVYVSVPKYDEWFYALLVYSLLVTLTILTKVR